MNTTLIVLGLVIKTGLAASVFFWGVLGMLVIHVAVLESASPDKAGTLGTVLTVMSGLGLLSLMWASFVLLTGTRMLREALRIVTSKRKEAR